MKHLPGGFHGNRYIIRKGKLVSKRGRPDPVRERLARQADANRAHRKRWAIFLGIAREYTSIYRHMNAAELIVHFRDKNISLSVELAEKLLEEIAREKKK